MELGYISVYFFAYQATRGFSILNFVLLSGDLDKQTKVFKEVTLKSVLSEDFKDANHAVVSIVHHVVEAGGITRRDHTCHSILPQDLMLILNNFL